MDGSAVILKEDDSLLIPPEKQYSLKRAGLLMSVAMATPSKKS